MLAADDPEARTTGLALLGFFAEPALVPRAAALLDDPDVAVRREAVECLASLGTPAARDAVWAALGDSALATAAVRGVATWGEPALPEITARLDAPATPAGTRLQLIRLIGLIPSPSSSPSLSRLLDRPADHAEAELAGEALRALTRIHRRHPDAEFDRDRVDRRLLADLGGGLALLGCQAALAGIVRGRGLVGRELEAQIESARDKVSWSLALAAPPDTMVHIFRSLRAHGSPHRDQARELLGTLCPRGSVRAAILGLLDPSTPAPPWSPDGLRPLLEVPAISTPAEAYSWMHTHGDRWLRAALRHDGPAAEPRAPGDPPLLPEEDPMIASLETVLFLKDVALFEALTNPQLVEVARLCERFDLADGKVLFRQGDPPDYMYLVRAGKLRVLIGDDEVARLAVGECVGEMAILAGTDRTATVEAIAACRLLRVDVDDFLGLLDTFPEIGRALLRTFVRRLANVWPGQGPPPTVDGLIHSLARPKQEA